ncbi:MAG: hypothetical protein LBV78_03890 [Kitasatospora sp.]|jgi:hypothetical protein|nr:hypothetical protein [Kitasatospora sp.]
MEHDKHDHEETGEPRVDHAVAGVDRLADLPPDEHVAAFEQAHATLRQVLAELDSGPDDAGDR